MRRGGGSIVAFELGSVPPEDGGFILVGAVLRWRDRRRFWLVAPVAVAFAVGYLGAFWNASGMAGFPAEAAKSVIAPDQQSETDKASDLYRDIENYDILFTIKSKPKQEVPPAETAPPPASDSGSMRPRPCPTSASSCSGSTSPTTRFCGSG